MLTIIVGMYSNTYAVCKRCVYDIDTGAAGCQTVLCISQTGYTGCVVEGIYWCTQSGSTCAGSISFCKLSDKDTFIKTAKYSPYVESTEEPFIKTAKYSAYIESNDNIAQTEELNGPVTSTDSSVTGLIKPVVYKTVAAQNGSEQSDGKIGILQVDSETILKMAEIHPRFALVGSMFLDKGSTLYAYTKSKITPVPITLEDIRKFIAPNRETNTAYKAFEAKTRLANIEALRNKEDFFEIVSTTEISNKYPNQGVSRFVVTSSVSGDPPHLTMTWRIKKDANSGIWYVSEWQIQ